MIMGYLILRSTVKNNYSSYFLLTLFNKETIMNTYNYVSTNTMWSMYLFNQSSPKTGDELLDEDIIRPVDTNGETITIYAK